MKYIAPTTSWASLIESCQRIAKDLERSGELSSNDVSNRAQSPRNVTDDGRYKTWIWHTVCPTLETHDNIRWNDCWKFDPENAVSADEWKDIASEFNISPNFDNEMDHRRHYPKTISGMYRCVRNTYESDDPRHGVSGSELVSSVMHLTDKDYKRCMNYLREFPDIIPPSPLDDRPDWEWVDETESDDP